MSLLSSFETARVSVLDVFAVGSPSPAYVDVLMNRGDWAREWVASGVALRERLDVLSAMRAVVAGVMTGLAHVVAAKSKRARWGRGQNDRLTANESSKASPPSAQPSDGIPIASAVARALERFPIVQLRKESDVIKKDSRGLLANGPPILPACGRGQMRSKDDMRAQTDGEVHIGMRAADAIERRVSASSEEVASDVRRAARDGECRGRCSSARWSA
ncbi:uncharacterized protein LAESUDRAFT_764611 [Laetiporus sulphureus 93-53]|uniref:Uncharacterized protein n=1 Tax=Laetiporus sulphureus 93-53 TaxID=1314785 RepID=A0A165B792_9APHY|nr:uncharacterized protein LAESUDRAFT_764611 [Laetiporus sulphureus 93-53]KZT00406.1 hypothetical protein LAESUDRAFT_764611 [Laetiporus sulphureus 93-53]